ncbi:hypothetical protein QTO30_10555 [Yoonia sp. GPGPB17]|uniref:hypothetical protein n=1 Tax=Yoonia sp. GPGPB17 TaxID=3026147 RepID=UPI0030BE81C2
MCLKLTPAEAILHRTGPNNITALLHAPGGFDPKRAFFGVKSMVMASERFQRCIAGNEFTDKVQIDWTAHVAIVQDPTITQSAEILHLARHLAFPQGHPPWRVILVNPDGSGWSGLILHFDHAIADGTRMARLIVTKVLPQENDLAAIDDLPVLSFDQLQELGDPSQQSAPIATCRIPFDQLRARMPKAANNGDALLRLTRTVLDRCSAFGSASARRKNHATVARIVALNNAGQLGNHARMIKTDLSRPASLSETAMFTRHKAPLHETLRMAFARILPTAILRHLVQAEFSKPGIIMTIVPVSRLPKPLFGLPLAAVHAAAPNMGRPLIALTATRLADGFDVTVVAHAPGRKTQSNLSQTVANTLTAMLTEA